MLKINLLKSLKKLRVCSFKYDFRQLFATARSYVILHITPVFDYFFSTVSHRGLVLAYLWVDLLLLGEIIQRRQILRTRGSLDAKKNFEIFLKSFHDIFTLP